ncbi:MAG TPA: hypothetical protein VK986_10145 [Tepidisphaeraceae bacterium]|nr:hypothetical protein [Tepidisphaeraceae bacterium]
MLVHALMNAAFVMLVALSCRRAAGDRPGAVTGVAAATAVATFVSLPYLSFRPATLAIVLLALVAYLLVRDRDARAKARRACTVGSAGDQTRRSDTRAVWFIVPITALLANVHLFAFLVPVWTGCLCVGAIIDGPRRSRDQRIRGGTPAGARTLCPGVERVSAQRAFMLFPLTLVSACATPLLPGVIHTLVHYQFNDPMVSSGLLAEMRPFWAGPLGTVSAVLVGGIAVLLIARRRELSLTDLLLLAVSTALLFSKGRYAPLFMLVATPMVARAWPGAADRVLARRALGPALAGLLILGVVRVITAFPSTGAMDAWINRHGPDAPGYPTGAAEYVEKHIAPRTGRVINVFNHGGYLGWRLGPAGFTTLMDGRTQCFSRDFWAMHYLGPAAPTARTVADMGADVAILPRTATRIGLAVEAAGWRIAFEDERARVWVPPVDRLTDVGDE